MQPTCKSTLEVSPLERSDQEEGNRHLERSLWRSTLTPGFLTLRPPPALRSLGVNRLATPEEAEGVEGLLGAGTEGGEAQKVQVGTEQKQFSSSKTTSVEEKEEIHDFGAAATASTVADEAVYEEVNLRELEFDAVEQLFLYPCPCGDLFELPLSELRTAAAESAENRGFAVASCPSCSLKVRVLFDTSQLKYMEKELSLTLISEEA